MLGQLLSLIDCGGSPVAIRLPAGRAGISRGRLTGDVLHFAAIATAKAGQGPGSVWVGARRPYPMLVASLGCLHSHPVALMEAAGPARGYDTLATVCPPALVVTDAADTGLAHWARAAGHRVLLADLAALEGRRRPSSPPREDVVLQFFTSGTTGTPRCIGIGATQLTSAIHGVAARLALTPTDISLSIAPLTHTLGIVTTVLVALASGGSVIFADPRRPREFLATLPRVRPTWCASSPSGHKLIHELLSGAGLDWPELRFLRSSAAPMTPELVRRLENYYSVPVLNAYAMTEAPGEIASQELDGHRPGGSVGRPSLCEVEIRSTGQAVTAGNAGEIWIRGPNVVTAGSGWFRTGDIGVQDEAGFLHIAGRVDDIINSGGLKIWPPDIEAAARTDPAVDSAVAFPIPHAGMGEMVGLAVVPGRGCAVDRAALRRRLMTELPRHAWPSTIVICDDIPRSPRGKIQRRSLWKLLPAVPAKTGN